MSKRLMDSNNMPVSSEFSPINGDPGDYALFVSRLFKPYDDQISRLNHAIIGICGEVGELVDEVKQLTIYDKPLNLHKVKIELGDLMFYMQALMNEFDIHWSEIRDMNVEKVRARYHKLYYSDEQALKRADGEAKGAGQ